MQARLFRMAALAVLASVFAAGCGKYSISNIRSLKAFQDANNLYRKQDYQEAIERYKAAIEFNPDLGFAYFFLGNSYDMLYKPARKGEAQNDSYLQPAVDNYRIAIEKLADSTDPTEREILQRSYEFLIAAYGPQKLDDFSQAEPVAREMIAMEPDDPSNYYVLGGLYEDQGMYEEAEATFLEAVEHDQSAYSYQILAGFYSRQGEFEKTMNAFNQRAQMEPNNPEAWYTIATLYQEKVFNDTSLPRATKIEYIANGLEAADKALAINPDYFEALTFKNILLRQGAEFERNAAEKQRMLDEAEEIRNRAIALRESSGAAGGGGDAAAAGSGSGSGSDDGL